MYANVKKNAPLNLLNIQNACWCVAVQIMISFLTAARWELQLRVNEEFVVAVMWEADDYWTVNSRWKSAVQTKLKQGILVLALLLYVKHSNGTSVVIQWLDGKGILKVQSRFDVVFTLLVCQRLGSLFGTTSPWLTAQRNPKANHSLINQVNEQYIC